MCRCYAKDSLADLGAAGGSVSKPLPVIEPAPSDYVVNRSEGPTGMIQVTMQHASWIIAFRTVVTDGEDSNMRGRPAPGLYIEAVD
jgi:hypothetical protein